MVAKKTVIEAFIEFLSVELDIVPVETFDGYIVVKRNCSTCSFYGTDKTKYCGSPLSGGCWKFEFNQKGR